MLAALGTAQFAGALYDEAAASLCAASDLNPADPEPYSFMGRIDIAAPKPLACVEPRLARFVQAQPTNAQANYLYAMALWKRQEPGPVESAYQSRGPRPQMRRRLPAIGGSVFFPRNLQRRLAFTARRSKPILSWARPITGLA